MANTIGPKIITAITAKSQFHHFQSVVSGIHLLYIPNKDKSGILLICRSQYEGFFTHRSGF